MKNLKLTKLVGEELNRNELNNLRGGGAEQQYSCSGGRNCQGKNADERSRSATNQVMAALSEYVKWEMKPDSIPPMPRDSVPRYIDYSTGEDKK